MSVEGLNTPLVEAERNLEAPPGWLIAEDIFKNLIKDDLLVEEQRNRFLEFVFTTRRGYPDEEKDRFIFRASSKTPFYYSPKFVDFLKDQIKDWLPKVPENLCEDGTTKKWLSEDEIMEKWRGEGLISNNHDIETFGIIIRRHIPQQNRNNGKVQEDTMLARKEGEKKLTRVFSPDIIEGYLCSLYKSEKVKRDTKRASGNKKFR